MYLCDLAIIFAYVFMEFLIIPVGMIFGARNSPSWWDLLAGFRSHLGTTKSYQSASYPIADMVELIPESSPSASNNIPPAVSDSHH